ncbi:MAG: chromosomal replication initiator protein DnaA [Oscillospiraceae bacterium]|nr:chromosomal replication initiator protein DnaA [Oscillospiraceae bacterium]
MNSAADIWDKTLTLMRKDLTEVAIKTWFEDCSAVGFSANRLYLHTSSAYNKEIVEERFLGTIKSALGELFSSSNIDVVILDDVGLKAMNESAEDPDNLGINEYTFEHFVVGSSNKFAHAAALAVADGHQKRGYNPLFIYGDSGLGKTHLLYAIRYAVETKFPHYNIVYVKGEDFTNDMILAIRQGKNEEFRDKYRGADFFLIDDIQFIAGKEATQEEYFNTFDSLFLLGKQIVLTSDRPPKDMLLLADRLRSRFESGLLVDIQPPDDALRIAIIKNKAEQLGVFLPDDVTNYIAENLDRSVRQLEGAVKMVVAYRDIMNDDITVETIKARLKDAFIVGGNFIPSADDIINETAKYYSQSAEDIKRQSRAAELVLSRQIAMYLIRKMTNLSLQDIGTIFDKRDHTTVRTSVIKIDNKIREDSTFSNLIKDITSNINSRNIAAQ